MSVPVSFLRSSTGELFFEPNINPYFPPNRLSFSFTGTFGMLAAVTPLYANTKTVANCPKIGDNLLIEYIIYDYLTSLSVYLGSGNYLYYTGTQNNSPVFSVQSGQYSIFRVKEIHPTILIVDIYASDGYTLRYTNLAISFPLLPLPPGSNPPPANNLVSFLFDCRFCPCPEGYSCSEEFKCIQSGCTGVCGGQCNGSCPEFMICQQNREGIWSCVPEPNCPQPCPIGEYCLIQNDGTYACQVPPECISGKQCSGRCYSPTACPSGYLCQQNNEGLFTCQVQLNPCEGVTVCGGPCSGTCPSNQKCTLGNNGVYSCVAPPPCTVCGGSCNASCPDPKKQTCVLENGQYLCRNNPAKWWIWVLVAVGIFLLILVIIVAVTASKNRSNEG
ncbi:MAG: hypothetical protein ACYCQJ_12370 [Nitrososphaerales archaeon]